MNKSVNMNMIKRILIKTLKALVGLAAAANLVALFVYHYELPDWLRRELPAPTPNAEAVIEPGLVSPIIDPSVGNISFVIPVVPVNYSGEANLDEMVLSGVYIRGSDGQPVEGVPILYDILPGESRLKKVIQYTARVNKDITLTETRVMNLTSRYTGPTITLMGPLPDIDPADEAVYVGRLGVKGIIKVDDGFGNDAIGDLEAVFHGLSEEEPEAVMTLSLENQVHDTSEMELTVSVEGYTGIVLKLKQYSMTLNVGDDFDPYAQIEYAHDVDGTDLIREVLALNEVDTSVPGEYTVTYWVWNMEETEHSPDRFLHVTVVEPEAAAEADEEL